jgi:hypothetical protein
MSVRGTFSLYGRVAFVLVRRRLNYCYIEFRKFVVEPPTISGATAIQADPRH